MAEERLHWHVCPGRLAGRHGQAAAKTVQAFKAPGKKAFVVDDTVAGRFGKKMPGLSSHFDHTTFRTGANVISIFNLYIHSLFLNIQINIAD
jgi:hypothetical protein